MPATVLVIVSAACVLVWLVGYVDLWTSGAVLARCRAWWRRLTSALAYARHQVCCRLLRKQIDLLVRCEGGRTHVECMRCLWRSGGV